MTALDKTILALDNIEAHELPPLLKNIRGRLSFLKIGLELFCLHGPIIMKTLEREGEFRFFLDLKLHDIPNTVFSAIKSLQGLPISFLTIHLAGGERMIEEALKAQAAYLPKTQLLGVTYLTSLGSHDFQKIWGSKPQENFEKMFHLALETNVHGIVLSPQELPLLTKLEKQMGKSLIKVCPGIRFPDEATHDQQRITSPEKALQDGANFLVMGRSLTKALNLETRLKELERINVR